jgi:hypothetical protein
MQTIEGVFSHPLDPIAIENGWHNRYANSTGALEANLQTDGTKFCITFSPYWDIQSLKHSFGLEVHRLDPTCEIKWL